jgi:hypothetical protein
MIWKVTEKQHTPILTGLRVLTADREWEVEVVPGDRYDTVLETPRSNEIENHRQLETLRIFGIGKEDGKRIIDRLGHTLLNEHENDGTHFPSGPVVWSYLCQWGNVGTKPSHKS